MKFVLSGKEVTLALVEYLNRKAGLNRVGEHRVVTDEEWHFTDRLEQVTIELTFPDDATETTSPSVSTEPEPQP